MKTLNIFTIIVLLFVLSCGKKSTETPGDEKNKNDPEIEKYLNEYGIKRNLSKLYLINQDLDNYVVLGGELDGKLWLSVFDSNKKLISDNSFKLPDSVKNIKSELKSHPYSVNIVGDNIVFISGIDVVESWPTPDQYPIYATSITSFNIVAKTWASQYILSPLGDGNSWTSDRWFDGNIKISDNYLANYTSITTIYILDKSILSVDNKWYFDVSNGSLEAFNAIDKTMLASNSSYVQVGYNKDPFNIYVSIKGIPDTRNDINRWVYQIDLSVGSGFRSVSKSNISKSIWNGFLSLGVDFSGKSLDPSTMTEKNVSVNKTLKINLQTGELIN